MIACQALEESKKANEIISKHVDECTLAWKDCNKTLTELKQRWEKVGWLICCSVLTGSTAIVLKEFLSP